VTPDLGGRAAACLDVTLMKSQDWAPIRLRTFKFFQDCQYRHGKFFSQDTPRLTGVEGVWAVSVPE